MATRMAACGIDCSKCEGYIMTQANDVAGMEKIAAKWREEYHSPEITAANVICDGCMTEGGRPGGYCAQCGIRKCCRERGLDNCAHCGDFACGLLEEFFKRAPHLRAALDAVRKEL